MTISNELKIAVNPLEFATDSEDILNNSFTEILAQKIDQTSAIKQLSDLGPIKKNIAFAMHRTMLLADAYIWEGIEENTNISKDRKGQ